MHTISAVILTKNNAQHIEELINSLNWCNEIVIIDDQSSDTTKEIAMQKGAKVFTEALNDNFANQRNVGLEKASKEWVLFIDSDERISQALAQEIQSTIRKNEYSGFFLKRDDYMYGKIIRFGETASVRLLRLAKRNAGKWENNVHEIWNIKDAVGVLSAPLQHYPHPSVKEFLADINQYSTLVAKERFKKKIHVSPIEIIIFPVGKFIQNFLIRQGFRDGMPGAIIAIMMSFHSFLVRGKLYLLQTKA